MSDIRAQIVGLSKEENEVISDIREFNEGIPFSRLTDTEVRFWKEKFQHLKVSEVVSQEKKFSQFLQEAFEEVKKTYEPGYDGNKENINALRHFLSVTADVIEKWIFNPIFDLSEEYKELRFESFNKYIQFLKDGGEGKTYRTQQDLAVMKELFERGFDVSKKEEFTTEDGQKVIILTNEKGETFVIGDVGKDSETENTLQKYIGYLKSKYGETSKTVKILIPQTTGGHWTLFSAAVQLPDKIVSNRTTYDSMAEDDPLGLGKRQRDGWSCGIHTMEAVSKLINEKSQDRTQLDSPKRNPESPAETEEEQSSTQQPKRQKTMPSEQKVSERMIAIADTGVESEASKASKILRELAKKKPSYEDLRELAVPAVSPEGTSEEKEERDIKLRVATVQRIIESGETIPAHNEVLKFISGKIDDPKSSKVLIEEQLSSLPKEVRLPNGDDEAKFPCKDKVVLKDDGTTTVSFTFDKSQLGLQGGGQCTVEIVLPKNVLANPELLDAIRGKTLGEYLEGHPRSSLNCSDTAVKREFENRFNGRSSVLVR